MSALVERLRVSETMKSRLKKIADYRALLSLIAILIFFSNTDIYLFLSHHVRVHPYYWVFTIAAFTVPLALQETRTLEIFRSGIVLFAFFYVLLAVAYWLISSHDVAARHELTQRIYSAAFIVMLWVLFKGHDSLVPQCCAILVVVVVAIGLNLYELFSPASFSLDVCRSAGLYMNSNQSAAAIVMGMILSVRIMHPKFRPWFVMLAGTGVLVTFSRGGLIGWGLVLFILLFTNNISRRDTLVAFLVFIGVGITCVSLYSHQLGGRYGPGCLKAVVVDRLAFLSVVPAIDKKFAGAIAQQRKYIDENLPPSSQKSLLDYSADEREGMFSWALRKIRSHPWVGNGLGATREGIGHRPHNIYLEMMVQHGVWGVLIFPLLLMIMIGGRKPQRKALAWSMVAFLAWWGMVSHNVLEERYLLLAIVLQAALARFPETKETT